MSGSAIPDWELRPGVRNPIRGGVCAKPAAVCVPSPGLVSPDAHVRSLMDVPPVICNFSKSPGSLPIVFTSLLCRARRTVERRRPAISCKT